MQRTVQFKSKKTDNKSALARAVHQEALSNGLMVSSDATVSLLSEKHSHDRPDPKISVGKRRAWAPHEHYADTIDTHFTLNVAWRILHYGQQVSEGAATARLPLYRAPSWKKTLVIPGSAWAGPFEITWRFTGKGFSGVTGPLCTSEDDLKLLRKIERNHTPATKVPPRLRPSKESRKVRIIFPKSLIINFAEI
jgi:hypothetical protein